MTAKTYGSGMSCSNMYTKNAVQRLSREGPSCLVNNAAFAKVKSPQLKVSAGQSSEQVDVELVAQSAQLARKFSSLDRKSEHLGHRLGIARRCREDQLL